MNEELRKKIKLLKALQGISYKEIAGYLEISVSGIYGWIAGNFDLGHEKQQRLKEIISNLEE